VLCAQPAVGAEPFFVHLADDLIRSDVACLQQMAEVYDAKRASVLGVQLVPHSDTEKYGIVDVEADKSSTSRVRSIVEKPKPAVAPSNLAVVGRYVLTPSIFDHLEKIGQGAGGEIPHPVRLAGGNSGRRGGHQPPGPGGRAPPLVEGDAPQRAEDGGQQGGAVDGGESSPGAGVWVRCGVPGAWGGEVQELGVALRAGVHTGEVELLGEDVGGMAVHLGARVSARAQAGEVLVSSTVRDLVVGSDLRFSEQGEHELKGIPGAWRLYRLEPDGEQPRPLESAQDHMKLRDRAAVRLARGAPRTMRLAGRLAAGSSALRS